MRFKRISGLLVAVFMLIIVSEASAISEGAAIFLLIRPGARPNGMGGAFVAIADDATATYYNPAGLAFVKGKEVTLMHCNWLSKIWGEVGGDMYYEFASYVQPYEDWGVIGGNIVFLSEGKSYIMDNEGNELGTFSSFEFAPSLSYGTIVTKNLGAGVNLKIIHSHLISVPVEWLENVKGVATTWALDLGVLYKGPLRNLNLGANIQNIGPKLKYIKAEEADPLSTNLRAGLAYKVLESKLFRLTTALDFTKSLVNLKSPWKDQLRETVTHTGAEFWYYDLLALRIGWVYDFYLYGAEKKPLGDQITFGGGVRYKFPKSGTKIEFDFSREPGGELQPGGNRKFSLSVGF
ncbi:MAG: PorV/PorQ family protein [Candidatus Edwardsbacteria bacterium]